MRVGQLWSLAARDRSSIATEQTEHVLGANDCLINSILSTGVQQFLECEHLVSHTGSKTANTVYRFFHSPLHDAIVGNSGVGAVPGIATTRGVQGLRQPVTTAETYP